MSVLSWNDDESPLSIVDLVLGSYSHDTIEMHRAIGRRLADADMNQPVDKVIADAREGQEWALELIQTVALPAPIDRLAMPEQDFGTGRFRTWFTGLFSRVTASSSSHA
ncbi:hypothetical protein [Fulvimarina pelagi]|uniref:hypothetical protein n=1 Tax=Fulvimarina pelagi TaxID=217511 RepID=UPI0011D0DD89|nr:hypothetical protein [Fulvimarina pelagi]